MSSTESRARMDLASSLRALAPAPAPSPDFAALYAAEEARELLRRRRRTLLFRTLPIAACLVMALTALGLKSRPRQQSPFVSASGAVTTATEAARSLLAPGLGGGGSALEQFASSTLSPRGPFFEQRGGGLESLVSDYIDRLWGDEGANDAALTRSAEL
ncbi:MAG TPA: hypothetical protein VMC79_06810 [Rectinemataceae bacterium]|nr:hypothetical protein [Rectinemataceae bacterium]